MQGHLKQIAKDIRDMGAGVKSGRLECQTAGRLTTRLGRDATEQNVFDVQTTRVIEESRSFLELCKWIDYDLRNAILIAPEVCIDNDGYHDAYEMVMVQGTTRFADLIERRSVDSKVEGPTQPEICMIFYRWAKETLMECNPERRQVRIKVAFEFLKEAENVEIIDRSPLGFRVIAVTTSPSLGKRWWPKSNSPPREAVYLTTRNRTMTGEAMGYWIVEPDQTSSLGGNCSYRRQLRRPKLCRRLYPQSTQSRQS